MNIALLSDTHGHIDDRIKRHVEGCDEVWHAGDIGDLHVTDALADITKVRAVYGNIDDQLARRTWPEPRYWPCRSRKAEYDREPSGKSSAA